jgi:hypothetical protein
MYGEQAHVQGTTGSGTLTEASLSRGHNMEGDAFSQVFLQQHCHNLKPKEPNEFLFYM